MSFLLGFVEIFEFAATVPDLVVVEVLNLTSLERGFKPEVFCRADFVDGIECLA